MAPKKEPVKKLRVRAASAAVWANQKDDGPVRLAATFNVQYRTGNEWKDCTSYGLLELLMLVRVIDQCIDWIAAEESQRSSAGASSE